MARKKMTDKEKAALALLTPDQRWRGKAIPQVSKALAAIDRIGKIAARGGSTPSQSTKILSALTFAIETLEAKFQVIHSAPQGARVAPVLFTFGDEPKNEALPKSPAFRGQK